jgi:hypothetical protein
MQLSIKNSDGCTNENHDNIRFGFRQYIPASYSSQFYRLKAKSKYLQKHW